MYFHFMAVYIIDWLSLIFFLISLRKILVGSAVVVIKLLLLMISIILMLFLLINYKRVAFISFCYHSSLCLSFPFVWFKIFFSFFIVGRIVPIVLYVVLFEKSFYVIRHLVSHVVLFQCRQSIDCCSRL